MTPRATRVLLLACQVAARPVMIDPAEVFIDARMKVSNLCSQIRDSVLIVDPALAEISVHCFPVEKMRTVKVILLPKDKSFKKRDEAFFKIARGNLIEAEKFRITHSIFATGVLLPFITYRWLLLLLLLFCYCS